MINFGYKEIATQIAAKTYEMVQKIGDREYYNTDSCTGNGLDPFWGWSLLAYFMPLECDAGLDPTWLILDAWSVLLSASCKCQSFQTPLALPRT